jgi:hypothetical protein
MDRKFFLHGGAANGGNSFRRTAVRMVTATVLVALLAGCGSLSRLQKFGNEIAATVEAGATSVATQVSGISTSVAAPSDSVVAPSPAPATPQPTVSTGIPEAAPAPVTSNVSAATEQAIKAVIQRGNEEEVQAFAQHDPTLMRDTSTPDYYSQLAQSYNDMASSGVASIELIKLDWGSIKLLGSNGAQAITYETWGTTLSDGSTLQETDTNVYTLTLQSGTWLVQADEHPDGRQQGAPAGNSVAPTPITPDTPVAPDGSSQSQSTNWSGYNATGGTFTEVEGTWVVPQVGADVNGADATWVGIGGVTSHDLIQAGTQAVVQNGQVVYSAWWETLPQSAQDIPLDVHAGDTVSVSIAQQKNGTWLILIVDQTSGGMFRKNLSYKSTLSSAEWVEEAPATGRRYLLPLDNFGAVQFTNATAVEDGQQRTLAQTNAQAVTMYNSRGQALAQPSGISTDGTSFSVARTSTPANSTRPRGRIVP